MSKFHSIRYSIAKKPASVADWLALQSLFYILVPFPFPVLTLGAKSLWYPGQPISVGMQLFPFLFPEVAFPVFMLSQNLPLPYLESPHPFTKHYSYKQILYSLRPVPSLWADLLPFNLAVLYLMPLSLAPSSVPFFTLHCPLLLSPRNCSLTSTVHRRPANKELQGERVVSVLKLLGVNAGYLKFLQNVH